MDINININNMTDDEFYKYQEDNNYFVSNNKSDKKPFTIVIPPPNITGQLHLGHAFTMTMQDIIIRYKKMMGYETLLLPGTDHAAIATQMIVEKQLAEKGIDKKQLGRDNFIKEVWNWKNTCSSQITNQLRKLGYSADWSRERFTMDDGMSDAVNYAFIKLYNDGLIYKDKRLVNWDPKLLTTVSDLEVNMKETTGSMWYIKYQIENSDYQIEIATTRPETMLGDTAIAVNPNDERYKNLVGKYAVTPIVNRKILIVADDYADMTKGTGAVKITPAHDFNDFEVGKRHNLDIINILNEKAEIDIAEIPEKDNDFIKSLDGIYRDDARKIIVQKLKDLNALIKIEPCIHQVPVADRGGAMIEPRITEQWYLNVKDMAKKSVELVAKGELKFYPDMWKNTFFSWLNNIEPWCISRQLWWGHQIPAFYTDDGKVIVAKNRDEAQKIAGDVNLTQDADTLDTWFSSGLWAMSTLGWPNEKALDFQKYFPTSTLITGFDIIFFWVARMVMFSVYFTGKSPFKDVVLHGLVRDEKGQKMSKTKGNVINPLDLINEYGIDSVRWTICSLSGQGRDINFGRSFVENGRKFITKLTNACKYWEMQGIQNVDVKDFNKNLPDISKYILNEMNITIEKAKSNIESYRFDEYANTIYHFVWDEFCDNFIELSKPELETDNKNLILQTARIVIENILKMLQPVIPFVSARLWHNLNFGSGIDFINETYANKIYVDRENIFKTEIMIKIIKVIRNIRAENKIGFKTKLPIYIDEISVLSNDWLNKILKLTNTEMVALNDSMTKFIIDEKTIIYVAIPKVDASVERQKRDEKIKELEQRIASLKAQIEKMSGKAKPEIIDARKESLSKAENELELLRK